MSMDAARGDSESRSYRLLAVAIGTIFVAVAGARILAVFTESVNWDEFALLQRAVITAATGQVVGGGRPGLGTLILVPFAWGCTNAVDALVDARLLWTLLVLASAAAFGLLLRSVIRPSPHRWLAVLSGVGLWVLAPPFLRFSTQVRTDQPAILFGLVGGILLIASRLQPVWASVAAGALFGFGFLFSQKLLYVAGLAGALAAGQLVLIGEWRPRREGLRIGLTAGAFLLVLVAYGAAMGHSSSAQLLPVGGQLDVFEYYRQYFGWSLYRRMLPLLAPQILAAGTLVVLGALWFRARGPHGREILAGSFVAAAGLAVLLFHAARFPYFYLTLGLFPAAIGALVMGPVIERCGRSWQRAAFISAIWLPLAILGILQGAAFTLDSQSHQRESLAFVQRNFPADSRGFDGHGAFACRHDPDPFPVRFNQNVIADFHTEGARERTEQMLAEFRSRNVSFLILPMEPGYPNELWEFWRTRYVHYHAAVKVAGGDIRGPAGSTMAFEAVAPGAYIWRPEPGSEALPLEVNGREVPPGGVITLTDPGPHRLGLPAGGAGLFVLALTEPPSPDTARFFRGF